VLLLIGAASVLLAVVSASYIAFAGYANDCGHGMRIVGAVAAGLATSLLLLPIRLPAWAVWAAVGVTAFFFMAALGLSNDYLAGGGCRYADRAATEDAVSAGLGVFSGTLALGFALRRGRR
jgi:hypothetical protein